MEQLYDVLAQMTDINTDIADMIQLLKIFKQEVDVKMNDEARCYVRLMLRWLESLEKDVHATVDLLDVTSMNN